MDKGFLNEITNGVIGTIKGVKDVIEEDLKKPDGEQTEEGVKKSDKEQAEN